MIVDESGLLCICGQWVDGIMHGECRALMSTEQYEKWTETTTFRSNEGGSNV